MPREYTPAVERAFAVAAGWSNGSERAAIGAAELLLGLLSEEECRAARMLAAAGIDENRVLAQFPQLRRAENERSRAQPSVEVLAALDAAEDRLFELAQPLVLATEHVLLGLAASGGDVADWLRERGLDADKLEEEIYQLAGHVRGPLPVEPDSPVEPERPAGTQIFGGHQRPSDKQQRCAANEQVAILRILDAEANRAQEALRVIEDYVRFALDDRFLTEQVKDVRHRLTQLLMSVPMTQRLAARQSQADVGLGVSPSEPAPRATSLDVVTASFKRVQQALRSLEEYVRPVVPHASPELEQLRYTMYTLERAVCGTQSASQRLADVRLYILVDGRSSTAKLEELVRQLLAGGADAIQLRDKQLSDRELVDRARTVRELTAQHDRLFIVNDRPDIAVLSRADGVHVGQDELSVKDARTIVGPDLLVGVSTHSIEQARQAVLDGADYIGVGPVFPSATKHFERFPGVDLVRQVVAELRIPAFAIGGIGPENISQVITAGATRVALGSAVSEASDPTAALRQLRSAISTDKSRTG